MKAKKVILPLVAGLALVGLAACSDTETTSSEVTSETTTTTTSASTHAGALTTLSLSSANATTSYALGEEFDSSNLIVTAVYSDNTTERLTEGQYTVDSSEFNNQIAGTYTIHVIYVENQIRKTASYNVTVASILDSLTTAYLLGINASGMETDYRLNGSVDTTGLVVTATYSDGTEKDVTSETTTDFSAFDSTQLGVYMLKFSYSEDYELNGKSETKTSETFLLATVDAKIYAIEFESGTTTVEQDTIGPDGTMNTLDVSDWVVKATFISDDYKTKVSKYIDAEDLTISGFDSGSAGTQKVTLTYTHGNMSKSTTVDITVTAIADPDYYFDASTLEYTAEYTYSVETAIDDIISAGPSCKVKLESSAKEYGTLSFTKRLQTNGAGKANSKNYIKFTLTKAATVAIIGRSSDAAKLVTAAGFYDENNSLVSTSYAYTTSIAKYKYTLSAGTYYFLDPTYAVQVYGIQIWYN